MVTFLLLSVLILLHELGHFLTARRFGVRIEEFGFGLPPKMLRLFKRGETEYTLNWLPLGGFVRLFGEDNDLSVLSRLNPLVKNRSFAAKASWQRALILLAGVGMNFLLGIFIFSVIYSISGVPKVDRNYAVVTEVAKGSPADLAGIKMGEAVVTVDGEAISTSEEFVEIVGGKKGKLITFRIAPLLADGRLSESEKIISAVPREKAPEGEGSLGVAIVTVPVVKYEKKPWYAAPYYGIVEGLKESYAWANEIVHGIGLLGRSLLRGKLPEGMSGPWGVLEMGENIYKTSGVMGSLRFGAILSINLAIFNLLPFPGLDGGRLLFLGLEKVIGRKRVNKYENYIHTGGVFLLILLLVVVTWRDIWG